MVVLRSGCAGQGSWVTTFICEPFAIGMHVRLYLVNVLLRNGNGTSGTDPYA
jgi:hypothetical protein